MPDLETVSFFNRVSAALDLTAEQKERAWSLMTKADVGRDDPTSLYFAILARFDGLTSGLAADLERTGGDLVARMQSAMSDEMRRQLASLPKGLSSKLDARMEKFVGDLAANVDQAVAREADRRQKFRLTAFALGAAMLALVALGLGFQGGRAAASADAAKWSALVDLPQGGKWLTLARLNDLDKALAQSCGPAASAAVISGAKVCDLRLFTTPPVATSEGVNFVRLSLSEYAVKLGWLGYAIAALAGAFVARLLSVRKH